jgi:hypothetical protein
MFKSIFIIVLIAISLYCCKSETRTIEILKDGVLSKGQIIDDSLYHGIVRFYGANNENLGYSTYKYGIQNGWSVRYNGQIKDSVFYRNGYKNGYGYVFKNNIITYQGYYYQDRNVGGTFRYDSNGNVLHYSFLNFEGKVIYEARYDDSIPYVSDTNVFRFNVYDREINGVTKPYLFLYLVFPPHYKCHYEIAQLDSSKKIVDSKKIPEYGFFYDAILESLPAGKSYAIVMYVFNPLKNRDDLFIQEIIM